MPPHHHHPTIKVHHPRIRKSVDDLYVYVSKNDKALSDASRAAHLSWERRLGDASEQIFVSPESFTIDVSLGDSSNRAKDGHGHGYFIANRLVTFDLWRLFAIRNLLLVASILLRREHLMGVLIGF